jgi:hypothetical protein
MRMGRRKGRGSFCKRYVFNDYYCVRIDIIFPLTIDVNGDFPLKGNVVFESLHVNQVKNIQHVELSDQ